VWTDARLAEVLPVCYFHIVFTLPHELCSLILQNKVLFYSLLFQAASQTLLTLAADPRRLGAHIGFLAVLHTWGQVLQFHPHLHCVIPGGGIGSGGMSWVPSGESFFLPVRVLSVLYRGKFLSLIRHAYDSGQIQFQGSLAELRHPDAFRALMDALQSKTWGVHVKKPFSTPERVVKYLARYTHRIAISNGRLVSIDDGRVTFSWKDRENGNKTRLMTLPAVEFLRRFLQHELPKGFVRIRYYGLLANRHRKENIARCRELIAEQAGMDSSLEPGPTLEPSSGPEEPDDPRRCPFCQSGHLRHLRELLPGEVFIATTPRPTTAPDSS
jgi:hypothetical protein